MRIKVKYIECGIYANKDETLHFTQDNNENNICIETGEVVDVYHDKDGNIIEINY